MTAVEPWAVLTSGIGLRVDTSDLTVEQTVDTIIDRWDDARTFHR